MAFSADTPACPAESAMINAGSGSGFGPGRSDAGLVDDLAGVAPVPPERGRPRCSTAVVCR
jgi:hypothetical protein